jgi:hypothetical protein
MGNGWVATCWGAQPGTGAKIGNWKPENPNQATGLAPEHVEIAREESFGAVPLANFACELGSGLTVSIVRRPSDATALEIQTDKVAVVLKFVAIDDFSGERDFIFQGSNLRHFASLPKAGGNDAGAMNTDVIGIGHFRAVGTLILRSGKAHNYRDR